MDDARKAEAKAFGNRLRTLRESAGLTQDELAKKCGCGGQVISKYERGEMLPNSGRSVALADALGCTLDQLLRDPPPNMGIEDEACDGVERDLGANKPPRGPIAESAAR